MSGFVLHPDAPCGPLNEIWKSIAADNSRAADGFLDEIHDAIRALVAFPRPGHIRADLTSRPLRFQAVRDFLIGYAPDEKPLLVLRCFTAGGILV